MELHCLNCTANCCRLVIEVDRDEYNNFVTLGYKDSFDTKTDIFIKNSPKYESKREFLDNMHEESESFAEMKKKENGYCVHLNDESLCSIYENRPQVCKDYELNRCEAIRCMRQ